MKAPTIILLCALVAASQADVAAFRAWAKQHGKAYTSKEEAYRAGVFAKNMRIAEQLSAENPLATFGATPFADLTNAEFRQVHLGLGKVTATVEKDDIIPDDVDDTVDFVHMFPGVKNQGSCGSCYAFSAVANMEANVYQKTGKVVSLSEQNIVSCDINNQTGYPYGCNGGFMTQVDQWILARGGILSEEDWPYVGISPDKTKCESTKWAAKFDDALDFAKVLDDGAIIKHIGEYGPLSIGIESGSLLFQMYKGGIIDNYSRCGHTPDHGVTLVGYGTDDKGVKYWKVRNSWGDSWGEDGYVRMARGKNMCGINTMISTIV